MFYLEINDEIFYYEVAAFRLDNKAFVCAFSSSRKIEKPRVPPEEKTRLNQLCRETATKILRHDPMLGKDK